MVLADERIIFLCGLRGARSVVAGISGATFVSAGCHEDQFVPTAFLVRLDDGDDESGWRYRVVLGDVSDHALWSRVGVAAVATHRHFLVNLLHRVGARNGTSDTTDWISLATTPTVPIAVSIHLVGG